MRVANRSCPATHALGAAAALALFAGLAAAAPTPTATSPLLPPPADLPACYGPCAHTAGAHPLMQAVDALAIRSENPGATRLRLLEQIRYSSTCYASDLTPEQYEELLARTGLLPAGMDPTLRYFTTGPVWRGEGLQDQANTARRASLTYSFPDDGVTWGLSGNGFPTGPNALGSMFTSIFGAANVDRGRELVRQSLASWRRSGGITYREVADDNTVMTAATARNPARGDIRIGGVALGFTGVLAYNPFPPNGSDMVFNINSQSSFAQAGSNYRFLRNVAAHEHGHGMGYIHSIPCNGNFLMEPNISLGFDMLTVDERRGAGRNYGDRFSGNTGAVNAHDFGDLTAPAPRSVIERDLSINGLNGPQGSGADWFRFSLASPQTVTISATPTGGIYSQGQQSSSGGCGGSTGTVNASQAGNLNLELRDDAGTTILQTGAAAGAGQTETLSLGVLAAGDYVLRVFDAGPNAAANQTVQLYDLTVRLLGAGAPPQAIAGIDKRCRANSNCFFLGDINSRATDAGAFLTAAGFAWDLDGDGSFEAPGPQVLRQYPSNGVYDVTLRVTDNAGRVGTDTIQLTVFGATTNVNTVLPNAGNQGQTIPIVINGTNLKNLTDASMVTVSGAGVTVTGAPVSSPLGTEVTGLSLVIASGAAVGPRDITVSNADGADTGAGLFTVEGVECPADWDQSGAVNSSDISAFLTSWLASVTAPNLDADFNGDGTTNSSDISAFLTAWLAAVTGDC